MRYHDLVKIRGRLALIAVGGLLFIEAWDRGAVSTAKPAPFIECVAGGGQGALGGPAKGAQLIEPFGVTADEKGNWYICEYKGQRITKVDAQGIITLLAGKNHLPSATHSSRTGELVLKDPHGLVSGKNQQLYIADTLNHRVVKVDLKTGAATPIAGTGQPGYSGDGGPAVQATFNGIYAVDIHRATNQLYLADLGNRRIRRVDLKSGVVTTVAGNGQRGVPTDGADAVASPLVDPRAVAVDAQANVYILERNGNALRMVDRSGKIRTLIGPATGPHPPRSRQGPEPDLKGPKHLCVDRAGQVIIADSENHRIRKYNPKDGTLVVLAGSGEKGDRLVANDPLRTHLNRPHGVYAHPSGALYISDSDNQRVLKLMHY